MANDKKAPEWYTKDEMYRYLIRNNYSELIATELAEAYADNLNKAFAKGYEKAKAELKKIMHETNNN